MANVGFSAYFSYTTEWGRTCSQLLTGIVALEKVAGSRPVGPPLICRIVRLRRLVRTWGPLDDF